MEKWLQVISRLALWQKLVVAAMVLVIVVTWLAVCLVLVGIIGP